ncbi:MAG: diguanylate cyclase, partial [Planctomycetota bacterium]
MPGILSPAERTTPVSGPPAEVQIGQKAVSNETPPSRGPGDPTAELKAENDLLRLAGSTAPVARVLRELREYGDAEPQPTGTALLERSASGASWSVRVSAGADFSNAVLRSLPDPGKPPRRAEPLVARTPSLDGAWAVPLSAGGRTGLWIAPPPPTGGDEGRGRRLWEFVGDALWHRFVTQDALSRTLRRMALRDAQVALYSAATGAGGPHETLTRLLAALAPACGADRAVLHTVGALERRIAAAGAELPRPVAEVAAEHEIYLARAVQTQLARRTGKSRVALFDRDELEGIGVKTLIGRAAGVSIGGGTQNVILLLTKSETGPLPDHAVPVLSWAARFFAEALPNSAKAAAATREALRDGLTGLANRRAFDAELLRLSEQAIAGGGDLAVVMCDLDHFKSVNDVHGHAAGDDVLREAAAAIRDTLAGCRSTDAAMAARYGGEELAVLLPDFGPSGAERIAERIRAAVERIRLPPGGPRSHMSMSLGFAVAPFDGSDGPTLLKAADEALYAAKSGGRNRVVRA